MFQVCCIAIYKVIQIDSSTIDGNVEFVHSVQLFSYVTSVNLVFVSDKINNNSDNFWEKCFILQENKCNLMCSLFSVFTLFYLILENSKLMWANFAFLDIFDTCDVVHNWFISLLLPIVLDNLFEVTQIWWDCLFSNIHNYQTFVNICFFAKSFYEPFKD